MPMDDPEKYTRVMEGAREDVYVIATRRSLNVAALKVQFDPGRGPGPHQDHALTISTRDNTVSVERSGIPHEWIATLGSGYIDTRFVKCVTGMLVEARKKRRRSGHSSLGLRRGCVPRTTVACEPLFPSQRATKGRDGRWVMTSAIARCSISSRRGEACSRATSQRGECHGQERTQANKSTRLSK